MYSYLHLATLYSWVSVAPIVLALAFVASAQLGALVEELDAYRRTHL
jgi:hypothetical protein